MQAEDGSVEAPIGREISNLRMYVLNEYLEEAGLWETGEIYIAGTGVARGYLGRPNSRRRGFCPESSESFPLADGRIAAGTWGGAGPMAIWNTLAAAMNK